MIEQLLQVQTDSPEVAWSLIAPLVTLALGGILLITISSLIPSLKDNWFPAAFTAGTAAAAMVFVVDIWDRVSSTGPEFVVANSMSVDQYTVFVTGVICISVFLVSLLFHGYLQREGFSGPEWYVLILMSASGGVLLASAEDLIVTFIGLEILSIAVYVLASLHLRRGESQEAGFKYFLLGALSSALFLYGIALTYGATGSTRLTGISQSGLNERGLSPAVDSSMILVAMALLMVGFAFKVSAVPFHLWTPDVYEGSPSPVVAFMASAVKVAGFAGMLRVFFVGFGPYVEDWRPLLQGLAIASLVVGSLLAIAQSNVKRMLAYSSITHAGFILIGIYAAADPESRSNGGVLGAEAFLFYLLAYTIMVAGTFGVITLIGRRDDGRHSLDDYRGLFKSNPVLAVLMSALLFAQAGIPFTSGFLAKFRVIAAAAQSEAYVLAGVAMLASVVAAVLYLRIVVSMFLVDSPAEADEPDALPSGLSAFPLAGVTAVAIAVVATIALGVLPFGQEILTDAAEAMSAMR